MLLCTLLYIFPAGGSAEAAADLLLCAPLRIVSPEGHISKILVVGRVQSYLRM